MAPLRPSLGSIDMRDLELKEHLCAQTACLSSMEGKHAGTKVSSINRGAGVLLCAEIQVENLEQSLPLWGPPPTHPPQAAICVCQGPLPPPLIEYSEY